MTTATRVVITHDHDPAGVCWLCSDQVAWWKAAREKAGFGPHPMICSVCGTLTKGFTPTCRACAIKRGWTPDARQTARDRAIARDAISIPQAVRMQMLRNKAS